MTERPLNDLNEPRRLAEELAARGEPALGRAIVELNADVPPAAHFEAMAARVLALGGGAGGDGHDAGGSVGHDGGPPVAETGAAAGAVTLKGALGGKLLVGALGFALAGAGVATVIARQASTERPASPPSLVVSAVPAPTALASATAELTDSAPTAAPAAPRGPDRVPARERDLAAETALLSRAQSLLAAEPREALALTREHRRRYPSGALAEERDVVEIEALVRSGSAAEAKRAASRFLATHPGSGHVRRVRDLVAD